VKQVALTGGIACGKTAVGVILEERGIPVCEADRLAHAALRRGSPVYPAVVEAFGPAILDAAGEIDRTVLGRIVFGAADSLQRLNRLVHPAVRAAWLGWLQAQPPATPLAVVSIPLFYEIGEAAGWDAVICVACSRAAQLERLRARGLSLEDAEARLRAQWPQARKMERADYVIVNCGSLDLLRQQTEHIIKALGGE
jgi:dephospho-CoA kinase